MPPLRRKRPESASQSGGVARHHFSAYPLIDLWNTPGQVVLITNRKFQNRKWSPRGARLNPYKDASSPVWQAVETTDSPNQPVTPSLPTASISESSRSHMPAVGPSDAVVARLAAAHGARWRCLVRETRSDWQAICSTFQSLMILPLD